MKSQIKDFKMSGIKFKCRIKHMIVKCKDDKINKINEHKTQ